MVPVVLVHPFPFAAEIFRDDVSRLAPQMRVLTPDMRGFGGAAGFDDATPPSIDAMADDVARALDGAGIREPAVVGGLSMGGYVALAFARRHAARLRGLVLADTRAEPDSSEARANRDAAIARIEAGDREGFVDAMLEKLVTPKTHRDRRDFVERLRAMALAAPARSLTAALVALRDRPDARPLLSEIRVPTLVVVGAEDVLTPPSAARAMKDAIERAELVTIEDAGHLSNVEQPEAFREALTAFVARLATRR